MVTLDASVLMAKLVHRQGVFGSWFGAGAQRLTLVTYVWKGVLYIRQRANLTGDIQFPKAEEKVVKRPKLRKGRHLYSVQMISLYNY